ncbi:unnamed protein product [Staurois parvus]|uniref:Uncharacterized protein n=1 Tax=Staurois parvus TaxID=386267 RepID=A0ABN9DW25_9NEOB|nr:unnamed protein product [Staurois parvus]
MPASGFCVPVTVTPGRTGAGTGGKFENLKKMTFFLNDYFIVKHYCIKPFHIHFVPSALSCALPAFYCSFCLETEKRPWCPKSVPLGQKRF